MSDLQLVLFLEKQVYFSENNENLVSSTWDFVIFKKKTEVVYLFHILIKIRYFHFPFSYVHKRHKNFLCYFLFFQNNFERLTNPWSFVKIHWI